MKVNQHKRSIDFLSIRLSCYQAKDMELAPIPVVWSDSVDSNMSL